MHPRALLRLAAILVLLLFCLPGFAVARPLGRDGFWVRLFLGRMGWLLGLRVRVAGEPVRTRVLYAANHCSWLDILALGGATEARFIAKAEIAGWGLAGRLATLGGSVYVRRERRSATRAQADEVAAALTEGRPVALFAEGGTGDGVHLAPFRPALFAAADEVGATVQPVAIDYGARGPEIAWPDGLRFPQEMKRILNRRGAIPATLHFLNPLNAREGDRKALAAASHAAVAAALGK